MELNESRALVTGASSGIGRAVVYALTAAGAQVIATGRDEQRLAVVAEQTGAVACAADLTRADDRDALLSAVSELGELDLLILNAGIGFRAPIRQHDDEVVSRLLQTNLDAQIRLARDCLGRLTTRSRPSRIVVVGSIAGRLGVAEESVYAASKAGLMIFADSMRPELAAAGVGITVVLPGVVATDFFVRRGTPYDRAFPRPISPERVARALIRGVRRDAAEVMVPGWLRVPIIVRAVAPNAYARLAGRWG